MLPRAIDVEVVQIDLHARVADRGRSVRSAAAVGGGGLPRDGDQDDQRVALAIGEPEDAGAGLGRCVRIEVHPGLPTIISLGRPPPDTIGFVRFALVFVAALGGACTRNESPNPPAVNPVSSAPTAVEPPTGPNVRFVGRFDRTDPNAPRFAWEGTAIIGRFKGSRLDAKLKDDGKNWFQVILDGEPTRSFKVEPGRDTYPLAENIPEGVHDVQLYKRTEAEMGESSFLGFETPGRLLPVAAAPDRRIEFIGDSITAGYGDEGPGAACPYKAEEENEYVTYGALTARALAADHVNIAWSGKTIAEMTSYWERTLPSKPDSRWDFKSWTPHLVVVNIGTNNFANIDPGEERFVRLYSMLVEHVRKAYPDAFVICALGPMLSDSYPVGRHNLTQARKYMAVTMKKLKANDPKIDFLEFPEQKHSDGLGCGFHPSIKTHRLMADRLTAFAKEKLGW